MEWIRKHDQGGSVGLGNDISWDEIWHIYNYSPTPGSPVWVDMLVDKPELSPGQIHGTVTAAYVSGFVPKPLTSRSTAWEVTVSYTVGDPQALDIAPHLRPAIIELQHEAVEVPTFTFQDGSAILTKAGELIEGITRVENHWVFSVSKNVTVVPAWALNYADAVNSDTTVIRGLSCAAHYLLLMDLRVGNLTKEVIGSTSYLYFPVSFSLAYNPRTWKTKVLNRGLYQLDGGAYVHCVDSEGNPADSPQFLDAAGKQLPYPVTPASINLIEGWNHELLPFSVLPLA